MSVWTGIGAGAVSAIGGLIGNQQNRREAKNNRNWQSEMSNTAHYREVIDLKRAGLNPILSARHGGASTPPGAQAKMENVLAPAVSSAIDARRLKKDIEGMNAKIGLDKASMDAQKAAGAQFVANAKEAKARTRALDAQHKAIKANANTAVKKAGWDQKMMDYDQMSKRIWDAAGAVTGAKALLNFSKRGNNIPRGTTLMKNKTGEVLQERP